jgi:23S rRNA pseudouridine1911/1915/1917 synthase
VSLKANLFLVEESSADQRLDKWLATQEGISSRSRAAELIERGLVTVKGKPVKSSYKVRAGDEIQVQIPAPESSELKALAAPLDVLFEDEDVIVVNKPSGLVVHPAAGHAQDTLVNILLHHVSDLSMGFAQHRPGIVHRLDRDTSGILVVAKNDRAHLELARQFKQKSVHRIYWAIVAGRPPTPQGTIKSHLARHPTDRKRFASNASERGKFAVTHFKVRASLKSKHLHWIECKLETGRTHQIRVHVSENGMPIIGDPIYGGRFKNAAPRLALHASELGFQHPRSQEHMHFRVGWPEDLKSFLKELGFDDL